MKRSSQGGGGESPGPKVKLVADTDSDMSSEELYDFHTMPSPTESENFELGLLTASQGSIRTHSSQTFKFPSQISNLSSHLSQHESDMGFPGQLTLNDTSFDSDTDYFEGLFDDCYHDGLYDDTDLLSEDCNENIPVSDNENFSSALENFIAIEGASNVAKKILENVEIRNEIVKQIYSESHRSLKNSLKKSKLVSDCRKDRGFLLSLTPRALCDEFRENCNDSFELLVHGLLGITNQEDIFASQFLLNNISLLYSTIGKIQDRRAIGYALLLTTMARDGGLREDSLKLFSSMVHPRTSQKYDKSILAVGWDSALKVALKVEKDHFEAQKKAETKVEKLLEYDAPTEAVKAAKNELENLLDTSPPQLQMVWDNINLRTGHRYERVGDSYTDSNLDWMASMWIKDRIDANHMSHEGIALKDVENLCIKDMIPSDKEKDYIFIALIYYYSYRLVERHPILFKSIAKCMKPNRPHQFQQAMDQNSQEFTGELFTKSESRTEDLITMMSKVQLSVNTYEDSGGVQHCFEKKIVSGDNKTEKNMHYGILRLICNDILALTLY